MKVSVNTVLGANEWIAQVGGEDLTKKIRRSENRSKYLKVGPSQGS